MHTMSRAAKGAAVVLLLGACASYDPRPIDACRSEAEIRARSLSEFGEMIRHSGEEYAFVLEGTVELHTELYAPVSLEVGDSIYFDSGMGHVYLAVGNGPCRVLAICSGDESQLIAALSPEPERSEALEVATASGATRTSRPRLKSARR